MRPYFITAMIGATLLAGCGQDTQTARTTPEPLPLATTAPPAASEAAARADALIADMQRKQTAFEQDMRTAPKAPSPRQEEYARTPTPSAPPVVAAATPIPSPAAPAQAAPSDGRDESWWKSKMRDAEVTLDNEVINLAAAERAADQQRLQITYDKALAEVNARKAAVLNARSAVERIREDARRANVPPGWLRWP